MPQSPMDMLFHLLPVGTIGIGLGIGLVFGSLSVARAEGFLVTSPNFIQGGMMPPVHARAAGNQSPQLQWAGAPEQTQSFAVICDDPDAPGRTWVHWVVYDIPASATGLDQGLAKDASLGAGGAQGTNSWGDTGYDGPQPPSGTHRYFFKVYALDARLEAGPGLTKQELEQAMQGHVLAQAELMGRYAAK